MVNPGGTLTCIDLHVSSPLYYHSGMDADVSLFVSLSTMNSTQQSSEIDIILQLCVIGNIWLSQSMLFVHVSLSVSMDHYVIFFIQVVVTALKCTVP